MRPSRAAAPAQTPPPQPSAPVVLQTPRFEPPPQKATFQTPLLMDRDSGVRRLGFYLTLIYLFLRLTGLHEILAEKTGMNIYLMYVIGTPALICMVVGNGLRRALHARAAWYFVGFAAMLLLAVPFSDWIGGSTAVVLTYFKANMFVIFLTGGMILSWREFRTMLSVIMAAGVVTVIIGFAMHDTVAGRTEISDGMTMGNANDFAALLTLLVPFVLIALTAPGRGNVVRVLLTGVVIGAVYLILSTGSRGALVAMIGAVIYGIANAPGHRRVQAVVVVLLAGLLSVGIASVALPRVVSKRLMTIFTPSAAATDLEEESALESTEARKYLAVQSLLFTLQHPLFGVGPGQFSNHEGSSARAEGLHGNWHETHNTYTQVSSEDGVPALIFFVASLVAAYRLVKSVYRRAQRMPATLENQQIASAAYWILIALVAYSASIFFLSLAYQFYTPALVGIAIALHRIAHSRWNSPAPQA